MSKINISKRHHRPVSLCCALCFLFSICLSVCMTANVFAQEEPQAVLLLKTDTDAAQTGDTVDLTLKTGDFSHFDGRIRYLPTYLTITYDSSIFSYEGLTWHADAASIRNHIPTDEEPFWSGNVEITGTGLGENEPVLTLHLRLREEVDEGTAAFRLTNAAVPFGLDMQGKRIMITYEETSIHIRKPLSSDSTLHRLDFGGIPLSPRFDPHIYQYTASVPHHVLSLPLYYEAAEHAAVRIWGSTDSLSPGENIVRLQVTAQDGSRQEYVVNIIRALPTTLTTQPPDVTITTVSSSPPAPPSTDTSSPPSSSKPSSAPSSTSSGSSAAPPSGTSAASSSHTSSSSSFPSQSSSASHESSSAPDTTASTATDNQQPSGGQPVDTESKTSSAQAGNTSGSTATGSSSHTAENRLTFDIRYLPILPLLLLIIAVIFYLVRRSRHDPEPPSDENT